MEIKVLAPTLHNQYFYRCEIYLCMQVLSTWNLFFVLYLYLIIGHLGAKIPDAESLQNYVQ